MKRIMLAAAALLLSAGTATAAQAATTVTPPPGVHVKGLTYEPGAHVPVTHLLRPAPQQATPINAALQAYNWSGYDVRACGTCALRYVAASFTVPALNCVRSPNSFVGIWAGLDGVTNNAVEQIGVEAECSGTTGTTASYGAFYEMAPAPPALFEGKVNPGDAINVSVFFNAANGHWQLALNDITTGAQIAAALTCPVGSRCANSSAEVIAEAPVQVDTTTNPPTFTILPLADFGQANLEAIQVTSRNGLRGTMNSNSLWTSDSITMVDSTGNRVLAAPGPLYAGQAFQDTWRAAS